MTHLTTNLHLAWSALRTHRLRAFLTILGLTMGVATLITVITLIQGAQRFVAEKIANLGTDTFRIAKVPFATTDWDERARAQRNPDIRWEHVQAVRTGCPDCNAVGATVQSSTSVRYRNQELRSVSLEGQSANMYGIGTRSLARGRYFTAGEEQRGSMVCLLGSSVAEQLFPGFDPLGRLVRVGKDEVLVIGLFERVGSVLGQDQDTFVVVPMGAFFRMKGQRHSLTIEVRAEGGSAAFERAQQQARVIVRAERGIHGSRKENFYIGTAANYIALWDAISSSFTIVFMAVSAIAALVGGIVIMNIMLISVTERTKEIGVRRACGARRADVLRQFLAESVLLCLIGGACGVQIGFSIALLLRNYADFPADVRWWVALLGVAFAATVGLFFGIYPAVKAADLDPVEALRSE